MKLEAVKIGAFTAPNNVFLAPIAGYSNAVFREMCSELGAGLTFTEMVSAKALCFGSRKTEELLYIGEGYRGLKACQIFGSDPQFMRRACESEALAPFDIIDVNMGCPMPKIYKNGEGSALLGDLKLAERIISECKKSGKTVTAKLRIGLGDGHYVTAAAARACEEGGADMVTVHGRTREKIYSGDVNYREIEAAKKAVKIPVIANGGIFTPLDADILMAKTGADGVMIARGALFDPWLFARITGTPEGDRRARVLKQIDDTVSVYGERFALVYMRKLAGFYVKGKKGAASARSSFFACKSTEELKDLVKAVF